MRDHGPTPKSLDVNVIALVKGEERYVFLYTDENRREALRALGRFAGNEELSFSWYDAAVLSQRIRELAQEPTEAPAEPPAPEVRESDLPQPITGDGLMPPPLEVKMPPLFVEEHEPSYSVPKIQGGLYFHERTEHGAVIGVERNGELFAISYNELTRMEALRTMAKYAAHPEFSFSWYDAAALAMCIRGGSVALRPNPAGEEERKRRIEWEMPAVPYEGAAAS